LRPNRSINLSGCNRSRGRAFSARETEPKRGCAKLPSEREGQGRFHRIRAHPVGQEMEMTMNRLSSLLGASAMVAALGACADAGYSGSANSQRSYAYARANCWDRSAYVPSDPVRHSRFDSCMNARGWSGSLPP
jgi:hypothetical protein